MEHNSPCSKGVPIPATKQLSDNQKRILEENKDEKPAVAAAAAGLPPALVRSMRHTEKRSTEARRLAPFRGLVKELWAKEKDNNKLYTKIVAGALVICSPEKQRESDDAQQTPTKMRKLDQCTQETLLQVDSDDDNDRPAIRETIPNSQFPLPPIPPPSPVDANLVSTSHTSPKTPSKKMRDIKRQPTSFQIKSRISKSTAALSSSPSLKNTETSLEHNMPQSPYKPPILPALPIPAADVDKSSGQVLDFSNINEWTCDDVSRWAKQFILLVDYESCEQIIHKERIDGEVLLHDMVNADTWLKIGLPFGTSNKINRARTKAMEEVNI